MGTGAKIYVGNSYFESNTAARMGGAISGNASILQVLDSSFKANAAKLGGAIATNQPEAQLVLGGCDFDANDAMMGPKFGPAVAANGLVEDLGENNAQPEDLMCLDCELTAGIRIHEPQPQAELAQDAAATLPPPLLQQEDSTNAVPSNNQMQLPEATPLDNAGMGVLLPTDDEGIASMVIVEENTEQIKEETSIALGNDEVEEASVVKEQTEESTEQHDTDDKDKDEEESTEETTKEQGAEEAEATGITTDASTADDVLSLEGVDLDHKEDTKEDTEP